jgi:hypothetical protein
MIQIGDKIHAGYAVKGGAGFVGIVTSITEDRVFFRSEFKGIFGYRTFVSHISLVTHI